MAIALLFFNYRHPIRQPVIPCSKLTIETLKQGVKYVHIEQ